MAERFSVRDVRFYMRNVRTRMPFRYGVATLTSVPILHVLADMERADGTMVQGAAADILPPKWFDKDPAKSYADNVDDLLFAARTAAQASTDASAVPASAFDIWRATYDETLAAGDSRGLNHLTSSHGSTLLERALIDATGRSIGLTYHQMLVDSDNPLGIALGGVLPALAGAKPVDAVAAAPTRVMAVRHTVGLADPLRDGDITAEDRLDDGLPQSLQAYLSQQGLRWLKVKVNGDLEADLGRLHEIAALIDEGDTGQVAISLDGNEQYAELHSFTELLARIEADLPRFYDAIGYIEQPLERSVALDTSQAAGIGAVARRKPMVIDESDGDLDAFTRAVDLGYRGVSTKNCKGLFKALANAALARRLSAGHDTGDWFLTGEDLMNLPVIPVHQDLTHVAALGISHAERNGHHYVHGIDHLSAGERERLLLEHADMYQASGDSGYLRVQGGSIDIGSLQRPGLGSGDNMDTDAMIPLDEWSFESLA